MSEPIEEGEKVKAEIVHILYKEQIKYIKEEGKWYVLLYYLSIRGRHIYMHQEILINKKLVSKGISTIRSRHAKIPKLRKITGISEQKYGRSGHENVGIHDSIFLCAASKLWRSVCTCISFKYNKI